jgi:hypothetical protein
MKNVFKNWKTTSAGLLLILGSGYSLVHSVMTGTLTQETFTLQIGGILGGLGLIAGADATTPPTTPPTT